MLRLEAIEKTRSHKAAANCIGKLAACLIVDLATLPPLARSARTGYRHYAKRHSTNDAFQRVKTPANVSLNNPKPAECFA